MRQTDILRKRFPGKSMEANMHIMDISLRQALGAVIRRRRQGLSISQIQFSDLTGYDGQSSISRIERGEQDIPADKLERIATVLGCRVAELWMEAEGEHVEAPAMLSVREARETYGHRVPIVSWVQAGIPDEIIAAYSKDDPAGWVRTSVRVGRKAFALEVEGDSMTNPRGNPSFPHGSRIIVDPDREAVSGAFVVVRIDDVAAATFKKLVFDGREALLVPLNPQFPTRPMSEDSVIVGTVVARAEEAF